MSKLFHAATALAVTLALSLSSGQAEDTSSGEVALFLTVKTQPGQRDALVDLWDMHLKARAEEDTVHIDYIFALDMGDPDTVHITEVYTTSCRSSRRIFFRQGSANGGQDELSGLLCAIFLPETRTKPICTCA